MADAVQTQEAGGGEGSIPVQPPQEEKSAAKPTDPQNSKPVEPSKPAEQNELRKEPQVCPVKPADEVKPAELMKLEVCPAKPADVAKPVDAKNPEVCPAKPAEEIKLADVKLVDLKPEEVKKEEGKKEEVKPEAGACAQAEAVVAPVVAKPEEQAVAPVVPAAAIDQNANNVEQNAVSEDSNWQQRELELLKKIEELEKVKNERSEDGFKLELKVREEEIDLLKARVRNLETELHAALSKPSGKNHEMIENIKQQHEELLSKARGMIFDKTKMVKNQELQIEALTTQVQSLKDINLITKDLLEIRNSEVKAMEDRLQAMEARFKAEKERYGLVLQRAQTSSNINDDLKKEYETQLAIFKELREKYEQRVKALVAENERLKASVSAGTGTSAQ